MAACGLNSAIDEPRGQIDEPRGRDDAASRCLAIVIAGCEPIGLDDIVDPALRHAVGAQRWLPFNSA